MKMQSIATCPPPYDKKVFLACRRKGSMKKTIYCVGYLKSTDGEGHHFEVLHWPSEYGGSIPHLSWDVWCFIEWPEDCEDSPLPEQENDK